MTLATRSLPLQSRLARIDRPSQAAAADTFEVIWSTGAQVRRYDFWEGEEFYESLDLAGADLTRLNAGAPVLNSHASHDLTNVIGVVERAWVDGNEGRAEIRLSPRPEVAGIRADIAAGILRNVSIGYAIHEIERTPAARQGDPDQVRVTRFEPLEISLVPVPADAGAQVRRDGAPALFPLTVRSPEEPVMPPENTQDPGPEDPTPTVASAAETPDPTEAARAAPGDSDGAPPMPEDAKATEAAIEAVRSAERGRCAEILDLCTRLRQAPLAGDFIARGLSLDQVRAELLAAVAAAQGPAIRAGTRAETPVSPIDVAALSRQLFNQVAKGTSK